MVLGYSLDAQTKEIFHKAWIFGEKLTLEEEIVLSKDVHYSVRYAQSLKKRFLIAEPLIAQYVFHSINYYLSVFKDGERFIIAEPLIFNNDFYFKLYLGKYLYGVT